MKNMLPEKILEAVKKRWGIESVDLNQVLYELVEEDWVVWLAEDQDKLGTMRLIVPVNASNSFFIPSSYVANKTQGVSWEYEVRVLQCLKSNMQAADIIERHVGILPSQIIDALQNAPSTLGTFFIAEPLRLLKEASSFGMSLSLKRPGDKGGYNSM